jgi:16S rRNA (cytidine1402-2'-O)-methyltransferase
LVVNAIDPSLEIQLVSHANASLLQQAAASAAGAQHYPSGALYVVATPIGNLADITLRAIHVLSLVDAIACEDTRHSAPLLRQLGIDGVTLIAVHEHNEREAAAGVIARLARGERVACVTDAGTPAVSDPGAALVAAVQAAGFRIVPIPGASSAVAALSVAGDTTRGPFTFVGFLPTRGGERTLALKQIAQSPSSQVLFEAPHRIEALAASLGQSCGQRRLTVCRELTKQFETIHSLAADQLSAWLTDDANRTRGEFVLVLHSLQHVASDASASEEDTTLRTLMAELPLKQAVALTAELTGAPRNALYERALAIKSEASEE